MADKYLVGIPDELQAEAARLLEYLRDYAGWCNVDNLNHYVTSALIEAGYAEFRLANEQCFIRAWVFANVRELIKPFVSHVNRVDR